jgi:hypothetical protein
VKVKLVDQERESLPKMTVAHNRVLRVSELPNQIGDRPNRIFDSLLFYEAADCNQPDHSVWSNLSFSKVESGEIRAELQHEYFSWVASRSNQLPADKTAGEGERFSFAEQFSTRASAILSNIGTDIVSET